MPKLSIVKSATILEEAKSNQAVRGEGHIVSLVAGVPHALDGVSPVVAIRVTDPERDAPRLLRAAEQLLPLYREAPGIVLLDEDDSVLGIVPRPELEQAVLQMQRGDYAALAKTLGLRAEYHPIAGDPLLPFVYWECPECHYACVPAPSQENAEPDLCPRHKPPVQMERRIYSGK
ncbi:MAG: hypothetical protein JXA37_13015 [Chloroflexia bacterium]|nr:hypothetical protein [Chloroflexia bacterium]